MLFWTTMLVIAMLVMVFFFGFAFGSLCETCQWEKKYNELSVELDELEKDLAVGGTD